MSFRNNYNTVQKFAAFPCAEPSPLVIAITALPAIAPAIMDYATFGCRDILKARLGKQTPCGRAMKAQVKNAIPPKWQGFAGRMLAFEGFFSRIGDKFLIADLIGDSLARWTSLAYQLSGCPDANRGCSWQIEQAGAEILLPGVPTLIGGSVTNVRGDGSGVSPIGINCPRGFFAQISWQVQGRTLFGSEKVPLATWVREVGSTTYDFPATKGRQGYPWQDFTNRNLFTQENNNLSPATQYEMFAMADVECLTEGLHADCTCTPDDPSLAYMDPLGCLRDLLSQRIEDPAGRNPKPRNQLIKGINEALPGLAPRRGPPKGKPRKL